MTIGRIVFNDLEFVRKFVTGGELSDSTCLNGKKIMVVLESMNANVYGKNKIKCTILNYTEIKIIIAKYALFTTSNVYKYSHLNFTAVSKLQGKNNFFLHT